MLVIADAVSVSIYILYFCSIENGANSHRTQCVAVKSTQHIVYYTHTRAYNILCCGSWGVHANNMYIYYICVVRVPDATVRVFSHRKINVNDSTQ